jgi:subtilisin-like proprotein convertase family protein
MPAANYNFIIEQGSDFVLNFQYNDQENNPIDLSSKCIVLQWLTDDGAKKEVFSSGANAIYAVNDWSMAADNRGSIRFRLAANITKTFTFNTAVYDLDIITIGERFRNIRLATGVITLAKRNIGLDSCPLSVNSTIDLTTPTATGPGTIPSITPTPTITSGEVEDLCLPEDCLNLDIYSIVYTGSGLNIPDLATVSGSVITTDTREIENIEIAINKLQHNSPSDLWLMLSPPSGDTVLLSANSKIPSFNNNFSFMFSNKANPSGYLHNISNGGLANIYPKTNIVNYSDQTLVSSFGQLLGTSVTGVWNLIVKDTDPTGSGLIDSWKLIITYVPSQAQTE